MLIERISKKLVRLSDKYFANSRDNILRGDLVSVAEDCFPRARFGSMWTKVPEDLKRPYPFWDGRFINGAKASYMAFSFVDDRHVSKMLTVAGKKALKITTALAAGVSFFSIPAFLETWAMLPAYPENGSMFTIASWATTEALATAWTFAAVAFNNAWPLALLFPVFWWSAFTAGMLKMWERISWRLRAPRCDDFIAWDLNSATRQTNFEAYSRQVENATTWLADRPTFVVGKATGTLAARGAVQSPEKGQLVVIDDEALMQHMLILGQTGSGKTQIAIIPMFRRIMQAQHKSGKKVGAYVTDGKGVLWQQLMPIVADRDDVRVIGTEEGHFGVDLLKGLTPAEIGDLLKAVSAQMMGSTGGKDDFWTTNAVLVIQNAAIILDALSRDETFVEGFTKEEGVAPYSLKSFFEVTTRDSKIKALIEYAEMLNNEDDESDPARKRRLKEAVEAGSWLIENFVEIATETKTGYRATIASILGCVKDDPDITERFFSGNYANTIEIDHALKGGIVMMAVGGGVAGKASKLVSIWLKTRLMMEASRRNKADPDINKKFGCVMVADEFQSLVTVGTKASDGQFWNEARSSGLFLIAATQSLAALEQAVGPVSTKTIISNLATRILLNTTDNGTLKYYEEAMSKGAIAPIAFDNVCADYNEVLHKYGWEPGPSYDLAFFDGFWPSKVLFNVAIRPAIDTSRDLAEIAQLPFDQQAKARMDLKKATEEKIEKIKMSMKREARVSFDDLTHGVGFALCMVERAGKKRTDILDLQAVKNM